MKFIPVAGFITKGGKKYLNTEDVGMRHYVELSDALWGSYTCRMFATLLKENLDILLDY